MPELPLNLTGDAQAAYWCGPISRREAQKVFDEYGAAISQQAMAITRLDMCLAYMAEKFGVTPQDVAEWAKKKAEALAEAPNPPASVPQAPARSLIVADA